MSTLGRWASRCRRGAGVVRARPSGNIITP